MAIRVLIAFLLFVAVNCLEKNEVCEKDSREHCGNPGIFFPGNEEELAEICSKAIRQVSCVKEFYEMCSSDDPRTDHIGKILAGLHKVCDKDGRTYRGLARDISCIKETVATYNRTCDALEMETRESSRLKAMIEENQRYKLYCMGAAVHVACMLTKISYSCSLSAEKNSFRVLSEFKDEVEFCGGDVYSQLTELIDALEVEDAIKMRVEAVFDIFSNEISQ